MEKRKEPWRPVAERLFKSDPSRFRMIVVWINDKAKDNSLEVITASLEALEKQENSQKVNNWWPYANKIIEKIRVRAFEAEHEKIKQEEREW